MSIVSSYVVPHPPLIVPEIGRGEENKVRKTINSYKEVAEDIALKRPDTIVFISPHTKAYIDSFVMLDNNKLLGSFSKFGVDISYEESNDLELVNTINDISNDRGVPIIKIEDELDHGVLVPLYYIKKVYNDFKIIVVSLSGLSLVDHYRLGMVIRDSINKLGRKCSIVSSGDLSHKLQEYGPYGYCSEGVQYDLEIMKVLESCDFSKLLEFDYNFLDKASECGHRSFTIMAGCLDGYNLFGTNLSHEDVTGVGYGVLKYNVLDIDDNRHLLFKYLNHVEKNLTDKYSKCDKYVLLARDAINKFVLDKEVLELDNTYPDEMLNRKAGVFVSIHKFGMLRGCIGTISPITNSICEEIINNAISACSNDSRFNPITSDELDWLDISVDVLDDPEIIDDKNLLNPSKYGVIVTSNYKKGVLLPNLDGINDVDTQIEIALNKAGIDPLDNYTLQRFEVVRHD